jgi:hypothetical protein
LLIAFTDTVYHSARLDLILLASSAEHAAHRRVMFHRMSISSRISAFLFIVANTAILIGIALPHYQHQLLVVCIAGTGISIGIMGGFLTQYLHSLYTILVRHRQSHPASNRELTPLIKRLKFNRAMIGQLSAGAPFAYGIFAAWPYLTIKTAYLYAFTIPQFLTTAGLILWLHRGGNNHSRVRVTPHAGNTPLTLSINVVSPQHQRMVAGVIAADLYHTTDQNNTEPPVTDRMMIPSPPTPIHYIIKDGTGNNNDTHQGGGGSSTPQAHTPLTTPPTPLTYVSSHVIPLTTSPPQQASVHL